MTPPLASLWLRLGVRLAVYVTVTVPVTIALYGAFALKWGFVLLSLVILVIVGRVALVLFSARAGAQNGQSLSKQMAGLRVVDERGVPITVGKALLRELAWPLLLGALSITLIGVLVTLADGISAVIDDQRRRLIDRMLGTRVVTAEPVPSWIPLSGPDHAPLKGLVTTLEPSAARTQGPGPSYAPAPSMPPAPIPVAAPAGPPDGWYRDPSDPSSLRYWAAGAWTLHTHPG